jgi:hypothetical protein
MAVAPAQGPKHLVEIPPTWVTDDNIEIAWGVVTLSLVMHGDGIA